MQIIYHGSDCKVEEPKIMEGKYTKDFGRGFYCTILSEQAEKWARKYDTPMINMYEYNEDSKLKIKNFTVELIQKHKIEMGDYDVISRCKNNPPTFWELGRVYERLIIMINKNEEEYIDTLVKVLSSWIIEKIDNYNSSMYYENPSYIYECFIQGKII